MKLKLNGYYLFSIGTILILYGIISHLVNNEIVFPKYALIWEYLKTIQFEVIVTNVTSTLLKAIIAYLLSLFLGLILGFMATYKKMNDIINPYMSILKTLPTISVIIISLIWLGKEYSIYLIAILVILPLSFETFYHSITNADKNLKEVCQVYQFSYLKQLKYLYGYSILESLFLSLKQSFGLCFKIIVMSEVLTQANSGIGAEIMNEKTNANTSGVFIWTIFLIIIILIIDQVIDKAKKRVVKWK